MGEWGIDQLRDPGEGCSFFTYCFVTMLYGNQRKDKRLSGDPDIYYRERERKMLALGRARQNCRRGLRESLATAET